MGATTAATTPKLYVSEVPNGVRARGSVPAAGCTGTRSGSQPKYVELRPNWREGKFLIV
jgi:hypothetical protein